MKWPYWLAGSLLYLVFLAATAPASTLLWLAHRLAPAIAISATSGTIWRGEAQNLSVTPPGGQTIKLDRFAWNIHPLRLALGQLAAEIRFDGAQTRGQASLRLSPAQLDIGQLDATLPAAWLARIQPGLDIFRLEGTLTLRSQAFSLSRDNYLGQGEILWHQAAFGPSPIRPVGNYRGEISGAGERIQFQLHTQNGPLELSGKGTWSSLTGPHFSGTAKAREQESGLAPLLQLLGKADANGFYAVEF